MNENVKLNLTHILRKNRAINLNSNDGQDLLEDLTDEVIRTIIRRDLNSQLDEVDYENRLANILEKYGFGLNRQRLSLSRTIRLEIIKYTWDTVKALNSVEEDHSKINTNNLNLANSKLSVSGDKILDFFGKIKLNGDTPYIGKLSKIDQTDNYSLKSYDNPELISQLKQNFYGNNKQIAIYDLLFIESGANALGEDCYFINVFINGNHECYCVSATELAKNINGEVPIYPIVKTNKNDFLKLFKDVLDIKPRISKSEFDKRINELIASYNNYEVKGKSNI